MNKKIVILLFCLFLTNYFAILAGENKNHSTLSISNLDLGTHITVMDKDPSQNETVATSTLLADFASHIIYGEGGRVEAIMPGGVCPAHYEVTPTDYDLVDSADIIFSHGMEGSYWLNDLLNGANNTEAEVKVGPLVGGIPWGPPENAIQYVTEMTKILNNTYDQPENITKFNQNSQAFINEILSNKTYLEGLAATYGFANVKVVCMVYQQKFLEWLGFEVVGVWTKSDEQMSVNDVMQVVNNATTYKAQLIVSNLQSGTDVGAQIAAESNAIHVILSNFVGAVPNTPTYIDTINYNVEQLKHGKDLYDLYQNLLSEISQERDIYRIVSFIFIGISIVAMVIAVLQYIRIKKLA